MFSFSFYIALIFIGGNMGFPMGMPPGPEDPMMVKIAPEDCAFYASWSGVAQTNPQANPTEKWLSQPVTSKAITKLRKAFRGYLISRVKDSEPTVRLSNNMLIEIIDAGSVNPVGVYINKLRVEKNRVSLQGAIVVSLGDRKAAVTQQFDELYRLLTANDHAMRDADFAPFKAQEANGEKVVQLSSPVGDIPMFATVRDNYFVLGIGEDALAEVARNSKTPAPKWLAGMKDRLKIDRVGSVGFVDLEQTKNLFGLPFWELGLGDSMLEILEGVESFGFVTGLDAQGSLSRSEIKTGEHVKGLLSIIDLKPIPKRFLADVPADTTAGFATRLSTERILEMVKSTARNAGQEVPLNETLKRFQKVTGVSLEEELLAAVGDYLHAYYTLDVGNWDSGWIVSVRIEDEMSFPAIFAQINRGLKRWIKDLDDRDFSVEKHGLHEIYSVTSSNRTTSFAWAVVDDQWYFGRQAGDIIKHLKGQPKENQYLSDPAVQEIFEFGDQNGFGGPVAITHLNIAHLFEAARPFAGMILQNDERVDPDFDFKWSDIPPIDELINEVRPNFSAIYKTEQGFQIFQRQTYPGSSPPVSIAAAAIGALPTQMADMAGRNKLQRLGKAHLDFEQKHQHLCAAYSTDANGNALLSWRVHLLPFLGYSDLYDEFRLEEPWNSAHNFLLVEKMPKIYQHPSMKLDPNKTVFLAIACERAAFGAPSNPGANPPTGFELSEIKDGPENTAMLIELNKDHQVFWTKPEDTRATGGVVREKVTGIRDSRKFNIVLLNGAVHILSDWTPPQTLDNLFQRNDGNAVKLPRLWNFR